MKSPLHLVGNGGLIEPRPTAADLLSEARQIARAEAEGALASLRHALNLWQPILEDGVLENPALAQIRAFVNPLAQFVMNHAAGLEGGK